MGTKYSSNSASGYNSTPPADDGTVSEANKVKWDTVKTKLADPIKNLADTINSELATHFDNGPTALSANTTLGASHYNQIIQVSAGATLTLTDASTLGAGWYCDVVNNSSTATSSLSRATAADLIDNLTADSSIPPYDSMRVFVNAAANGFLTSANFQKSVPAGVITQYAGSSAPGGWLICTGSAVSRTTYARLFSAIGTAYGTGDGSTTFNLPNLLGRVPVGVGTGTLTEDVTDANVSTGDDTFTVSSNNTKWITGMAVVLTTTTTLPTGLSLATTYYVIRASSTTIKFASSRINASAGTAIDITAVVGSGTHTITHTLTARTLGEKGGEEGHTQKESEVGYHRHRERGSTDGTNQGGMNRIAAAGDSTSSQYTEYSNYDSVSIADSMNIMQPFLAINYIIKT